jgi:cytochrome c-type biogenesis protein CcmF
MLKVWNIFLITITYLLCIFGTFITRSGVVNSVHAFADSNLGIFLLYYMLLVLAASLYLIVDRRRYLQSERQLDSMLSRESAFLFNNLVLIVACFAVFWGTLFPVFSEWIKGAKITVGPPFFNRVNIPLGLLLLFLTGVGPLFAWRKTSLESLRKAFYLPVIFAGLVCIALLAGGMRNSYSLVCFTLCAFVLATIVEEFLKGTRLRAKTRNENLLAAFVNLVLKNKRRYGGYIVHLSIVIIFIGLTGSAFNKEESRLLSRGEEMKLGDYSLKIAGYEQGETPNYRYGRVILQAYKDGKLVRTLKPEKRVFKTGDEQTTTIVALYSTPRHDLYAVFGGQSNDGSQYEIKAYLNPLVFWLWFGAVVMVLGAVVTLLPEYGSHSAEGVSR